MDDFTDAETLPWEPGSHEPFLVGRLLGLEAALEAISDPELPALAGVKVAKYVLGELVNKERAARLGAALRHAAAKGVDIATHDIAASGGGVLVRPLDLVERSA